MSEGSAPKDRLNETTISPTRRNRDAVGPRASTNQDPDSDVDSLDRYVARSPSAIAVLDGSTQRIRYANRSFRDLSPLRYQQESLIGRHVASIFTGSGADRLGASLRQVSETGQCQVLELEQPLHKSERVWNFTIWPLSDASAVDERDLILEVRECDRGAAPLE